MIVAIDSNIIIYTVESDPVWAPKVDQRLQRVIQFGDTLAASDAARLECLVGPVRSKNTYILADYQKFFGSGAIQMLPATLRVWEQAARIRADYKFQALDSIHLATAIEHGCGLFLTNDAQLARFTAIPVEVLIG